MANLVPASSPPRSSYQSLLTECELLVSLEPIHGKLQWVNDTVLVPAAKDSYSQIQMSSQMLASEKKNLPGTLDMMANLKQNWIIICIIVSLDDTWKKMTVFLS